MFPAAFSHLLPLSCSYFLLLLSHRVTRRPQARQPTVAELRRQLGDSASPETRRRLDSHNTGEAVTIPGRIFKRCVGGLWAFLKMRCPWH